MSVKSNFITTTAGILAVLLLCSVYYCWPAPHRAAAAGARQHWTCGMHPQVDLPGPGSCPICGMTLVQRKQPTVSGNAMPMSATGGAGPSVVIDPAIVQNMGVRTAVARRGPLDVTVRTVGTVDVPEPSVHEINLRVNGWIEKLYADTESMHLSRGDVLFDLYSPDLMVAEEELIGATRTLKALDPKAPDSVRQESQQMVDSSRDKLRLWGVADQDIDTIAAAETPPHTVPFRSPASGDMVEKMVVTGSAVQAGTKLMRIEDHSNLWLNAQVYEDQIPLIAMGQKMSATFDSVPGEVFTGPIMFIHPHVDRTARTVMVRAAIENKGHQLHPGMYATVDIVTRPVADAVLVPREAVIDTGARQIAFVTTGNGHFDPRTVHMGLVGDDDQVQILDGISAGETVVTSGQFLMDVESRTTEAIDKLR